MNFDFWISRVDDLLAENCFGITHEQVDYDWWTDWTSCLAPVQSFQYFMTEYETKGNA
jgi:hypothetical protein